MKRLETNASLIPEEAPRQIGQLYAIGSAIRGRAPEIRQAARAVPVTPIVTAFRLRLEAPPSRVSRSSKLAEDIRYGLGIWPTLTHFLEDGRLELDTSPVENQIRTIDVNPIDHIARTLRAIRYGHPRSPIEDLIRSCFERTSSLAA